MPRRPTIFHAFLIGGLFGVVSTACAQSPVLSIAAQQRILQKASEALKADAIIETEYADLVLWATSEPCRSVHTTISNSRRNAISKAISTVQGHPNSKILAYFEKQGWYIIYTDASPGDEQYLVYDKDPLRYVVPKTSWSGAATIFETTEVRDALQAAALNIPKRLADCFAWHATLGR